MRGETISNPFAELANRLRNRIANHGYAFAEHKADDIMAVRIISELAKVEVYKGCITGNLHIGRGLSERFMVCRKIAAGGSKQ